MSYYRFAIFFLTLTFTLSTGIKAQTNDDTPLDLPEGMIENTDSMLADWHLGNVFTLDTTSQLANINPYFEASVYADRLKRIPCVMDMTYNETVQQFIDRYTKKLRRSVSFMLGVSNLYVPIFEEALAYHQIPLELKYLPVIESAYNPKARSRAGAMGLWQFMPTTGKRYGLTINSLVDERCDPFKSSYAAARYLKDLYDIFGDWTLVIAAYNCGPNNITKAIHRANGERDFWKIYQYLPRETRGYVPAFIAANYVMNYYGDHNILPMHAALQNNTDTILLNCDVKMERIAEECGIELSEIRALNPQYTTTLIPGYRLPSTLRLPQKQILTFIDKRDTICNIPVPADLAAAQASMANDLDEDAAPAPSSKGAKTVVVRRGQTLSEIARRNGTTVARIRQLNRIKGNSIRAGQRLRIR